MSLDQITDDGIRNLVDAFYTKIRADRQLGPIFERAIPGDWGPHLATMRNFWSSVMLTSGRYKGNPVAVHQRVQGIEYHLFDRWLQLFAETCDELFNPEISAAFQDKSRRIAESLKLAVFYRPDRPWPPAAPAGAQGTPSGDAPGSPPGSAPSSAPRNSQ